MRKRTSRDIEKEKAENEFRMLIISTLDKYKTLNIVDICRILSHILDCELNALGRYYNIVGKEKESDS
jgi:hypothetical protein